MTVNPQKITCLQPCWRLFLAFLRSPAVARSAWPGGVLAQTARRPTDTLKPSVLWRRNINWRAYSEVLRGALGKAFFFGACQCHDVLSAGIRLITFPRKDKLFLMIMGVRVATLEEICFMFSSQLLALINEASDTQNEKKQKCFHIFLCHSQKNGKENFIYPLEPVSADIRESDGWISAESLRSIQLAKLHLSASF